MSRSSLQQMKQTRNQPAAPFPVKHSRSSSAKLRSLTVSYSGASSISVVCLMPTRFTLVRQRYWNPPASFSSALTKMVNLAAAAVGILSAVHPLPASAESHFSKLVQHQKNSTAASASTGPITTPQPIDPQKDEIQSADNPQAVHPSETLPDNQAEAVSQNTPLNAPQNPSQNQFAESDPTGTSAAPDPAAIRAAATAYMGTPFVWGGSTPNGFDCSGFVQFVMRQVGIDLPRTTYSQSGLGTAVTQPDLQTGDLVFFQTDDTGPSHVGLYLGEGQFVHADADKGITIAALGNPYWQGHYLFARRVF